MFRLGTIFFLVLWTWLGLAQTLPPLLIGSYTQQGNPGLQYFSWNPAHAQAMPAGSTAQVNASYQVLAEAGEYLYSVSEGGDAHSAVVAYRRQANGRYARLNAYPTLGQDPCHILYRKKSRTVYTANYSGGSVSVFQTQDGKLLPIAQLMVYKGSSKHPSRQQASHAHQVVLSPEEDYLFVTDLGTDQVYRHRILSDGRLDPNYQTMHLRPGDGPRQLVFHPNGKFAFVLNELSGRLQSYTYAKGNLSPLESQIIDSSAAPYKASAHLAISPDWNYVLCSNRITANELVLFKLLPSGRLLFKQRIPTAKRPRHFTFDPGGKWVLVASQEENKVQLFEFREGRLKNTQKTLAVAAPVCLSFLPYFSSSK